MKKLTGCVALAALAAGCCGVKGPVESEKSLVRDAVAPWVEKGELPGAISYVYDDGREELALIGYADVAAKRPIRMDDPFMQCSQTKGFCGVTVAKLVEEGRIGLDDPVSKYLPEFKTVWYETGDDGNWNRTLHCDTNLQITVRMCLNHTAGFEFELPGKSSSVKGGGWSGGMALRQVAAEAAGRPLKFRPGTAALYSNTGIDVAAAVVEVVTGMKWEDYLKEAVLDPLGMRDTWFWPSDAQLAHQIEMYDCRKDAPAEYKSFDGWEQRPYNDAHVFASAGAGLWTTANDQLKFYKMLMNLGLGDNGVRILKEETVKNLLATPTRPAELKDRNYSLGLWADPVYGWFGHGGAWGTNCSVNWKTKQMKFWVVQLTGGPRPWDKARDAAVDAFFKTKVDNSSADAYTGRTK